MARTCRCGAGEPAPVGFRDTRWLHRGSGPGHGFYEYARPSDDGTMLQPTGARPGVATPKKLGLKAGRGSARRQPTPYPRCLRVRRVRRRAGKSGGKPRGCSCSWPWRRRHPARATQAWHRRPVYRPMPADPVPRRARHPYAPVAQRLPQFARLQRLRQSGFRVRLLLLTCPAGRCSIIQFVAPYYTAKHPRSYYVNEAWSQPVRTWELISEALGQP